MKSNWKCTFFYHLLLNPAGRTDVVSGPQVARDCSTTHATKIFYQSHSLSSDFFSRSLTPSFSLQVPKRRIQRWTLPLSMSSRRSSAGTSPGTGLTPPWQSIYKFTITWFTYLACMFVCLSVSPSVPLVRFGQLLRYADKRIVNTMKVYIERRNFGDFAGHSIGWSANYTMQINVLAI